MWKRFWAPATGMHRFANHAAALNVPADGLYNALVTDAEDTSQDWDLQGRQADAWKQFSMRIVFISAKSAHGNLSCADYLPQDLSESGGTSTRQVSRVLEVSLHVANCSVFVPMPCLVCV